MINVSNEMRMKGPVIIGFNFNSLGNFLSLACSPDRSKHRETQIEKGINAYIIQKYDWVQFDCFPLLLLHRFDCCCSLHG